MGFPSSGGRTVAVEGDSSQREKSAVGMGASAQSVRRGQLLFG